ncbi:MAG: hypothetical protein DMG04_19810, partial [Acidobacteria bacterium]
MKALLATAIGVLMFALPARAELVYFGTGRTMSVKSHRIEGDMLVLTLRTAGEMATEPSVVAYIAPDEVPYPEPETDAPKPDATDGEVTGNGTGGVLVPDYGARFAPIIDQISAKHGVDANLVRAVIKVESAYQEHARSRKGAMGLMQLMPATARQY